MSMRLDLLGCVLLLAVVGADPKMFRMGRLGMLARPPAASNNAQVTTGNFTQLLDHFDHTNNATWGQRYWASDEHYKKGGPVFIFLGGEAPASDFFINYGSFVEDTKKHNALVFVLEHRYYGKSHPTSNTSVENLVYLSSEQALADVATFVEAMNTKYKLSKHTKWIAFGGSYAGNLAAWVRYKYPHLIHAAVSSSAPVLAKVDFYEYLNVVRNSLGTAGKNCPKAVEQANQQLLHKLKTKKGQEQIHSIFNLCTPLDVSNHMDMYNLMNNLAGVFTNIVQVDNTQGYILTINNLCSIMTNKSESNLLQRMATVTRLMYQTDCVPYSYDDYVNLYKQTSWNISMGVVAQRMWIYQTCTEFGYYQTSEKKRQFLERDFPLSYFLQQCVDIFGKDFSKQEVYNAVHRTNTMYGGLDMKATRVLSIHGTIDPWHALGITKTRIPESPAILIKGTAHCANMNAPMYNDPPSLTAARNETSSLIEKWLKEK